MPTSHRGGEITATAATDALTYIFGRPGNHVRVLEAHTPDHGTVGTLRYNTHVTE